MTPGVRSGNLRWRTRHPQSSQIIPLAGILTRIPLGNKKSNLTEQASNLCGIKMLTLSGRKSPIPSA
jgi:hypothetical protein